MREAALAELRQAISVASGGISSQILYDCVISELLRLDVRGSILDLGAGHGDLTRQLFILDRFQSVTASDLMTRPPGMPDDVEWKCEDLNKPLSFPDNSFSAVASVGLIEYIENPFAMARELWRILRPGGVAILTTSNHESWRSILSLIVRRDFVAFTGKGAQMKLSALVCSDFYRILRNAGFEDRQFSFTNRGAVPGMSITWQQISFGALTGVRFSDDVIVTVRKPEEE